jgi:hypothetical protein
MGAESEEIPPHPQRRCGVNPPDSSGARDYHHRAAPDRGWQLLLRGFLLRLADAGAAKQKDL